MTGLAGFSSSDVLDLASIKIKTLRGQSSVSGLSSGAFMTVQLHLAHSASFVGAGIVAGGPYRCAELFRAAAPLAEDACILTAMQIGMAPLTESTAPNARRCLQLAREAEADRLIDPLSHLASQRVYLFTGSRDKVVHPLVVAQTRAFYEALGITGERLAYVDNIPAGHSLITSNPEDSELSQNCPPYLNNGGFMQSHEILRHLYPGLKPPAQRLGGQLLRFDQGPFIGNAERASMSRFGYLYVPQAVLDGAPARVHIALHGCKQGYAYTDFLYGRADKANQPPYGTRYVTSTGYNQMADTNDLVVLYPQAEGRDNNKAQNPDGCWDWWGYSAADAQAPDYFSQQAVQIKAIHDMLSCLGA